MTAIPLWDRSISCGFNECAQGRFGDGYQSILEMDAQIGADVIIFSDTNHSLSESKISDMFSPGQLQDYADRGVTDIYVESLDQNQHLVDQLARGQISRAQFVQSVDEISSSRWYSDQEYREMIGQQADMIIAASQTVPPISIHYAQISNTPEQTEYLENLFDQQLEYYGQAYGRILEFEIDNRNNLTQEDLDFLDNEAFSPFNPDNERQFYDPDMARAFIDQFRGKVPEEELESLFSDLYEAHMSFSELELDRLSARNDFRIANDDILADRVAENAALEGRGRAIIAHGAGHGATNHTDLDDDLAREGLSSIRINLWYGREEQRDYHADRSEYDYYPERDRLVIRDDDRDGQVTGIERPGGEYAGPANPPP